MKQLSIIVPIYNVEPYVERCLRSLEDQDIPKDDYEIICINDGSPDGSRGVVVRLLKEFDNIILINQNNQGVSRARNKGIDKACGKYLLFIDADDYVDTNSFGRILKNIEEQNAQVSFLSFSILNEDGTINERILYQNSASQNYLGIEAYFKARDVGGNVPDRMTGVLFERDFINKNNLRYLSDVPYLEDGEFIARILCLAERCILDGNAFLQGTTRPGSASSLKSFHSAKATNGFLLAASNLKRFQQEQSLYDKQRRFLNQPIVKYVLLAINSSIGWRSAGRLVLTVKSLKKSGFRRINLEACNRDYYRLGRLYNLSPYLGALALITYPRVNRFYSFLKK
jgi:glycosyltransferase involved in cell wall biosynthesis